MPKRKEPGLPSKEQFKRLSETVKKLGVDETGAELDAVLKKLKIAKVQANRELQPARKLATKTSRRPITK